MDRNLPKSASYSIVKDLSRKIRGILVRHTYLLLFIALSIVAYHIMGAGIIIGGDFPVLDTGNYAYDKLWIWLEKGGVPIYEGISRFPITSVWYILSLVGIDASIASKIMILMGFFVATFSFYFSFLLFFRGKLITGIFNENNLNLKLGAILGSLLFAYNIWSFHRIAHWHLWIGYSLIPLFFVSTYLSFRNPKDWKYILCSLFLWSFASMTPHMAVYYGFIFASIFLFFVIRYLIRKKPIRMQMQLLIPFVSVLSLFALVNFYWIYPYILGSDVRTISPDYVVTREIVGVLSRDSSFLNTFRIIADYQGALERYNFEPGSFLRSLWVVGTFAIPIFAFSTLMLSRRLLKYSLIFSGVAIIGIVMAMGTNSFYDYYKFLFGIPSLSSYLWIFRDPDKFTFLITFGYSFLIGIGGYTIIRKIRDLRKLGRRMKTVSSSLFMLVLIGFIGVSAYPVFNSHILNIYKPIPVPSELDSLNDYLSGVETDKVYLMPYPLAETYWKKDSDIGRIYQMHSIKPSIESTTSASKNYYNYLISSIIENRSRSIGNLIYPLGTSYLIFHNDTWNRYQDNFDLEAKQLLRHIYSLEGIKNMQNIGFYNIFKVGNETGKQLNLFNENNIAIGGLGLLDTLNSMRDFSSINSSIAFIDGAYPIQLKDYIRNSVVILTGKGSLDDLVFSFIDDKHIVRPFEIAHNYDPSKKWSKAGAADPLHGEFHPFLESLGIKNREFDFGSGLVTTSTMGANITVPLDVSEDGEYNLVIRLLENSKGGTLNIHLDGKLIDSINTLGSKTSDEFVWKNISNSSIFLEKGKHAITLENVIGLNAVNIIGVLPSDLLNKIAQNANQIINTKKIIYLLEGESSFDNKRGRHIDTVGYLFNNGTKNTGNDTSISGQFRIPENSDLLSLQIENNRTKIESGDVSNFTIFPAEDRVNLFSMDFERKQEDVALGLLRHSEWINHNEDALNSSRETDNPITGKGSLRVDVNRVDRTDWSILSTDFVQIKDDRNYKLSMNVQGKEVNNFHARVQYYDFEKTRIGREIVYESDKDSFEDKFTASVVPPKSSEFLTIQILVAPESERGGSYIIDNLDIHEIIQLKSQELSLVNTDIKSTKNSDEDGSIPVEFSNVEDSNQRRASDYKRLKTDSISVYDDRLYNYTARIKGNISDSVTGLLTFSSSDDVTENATKYGSEASSGSALSMEPNSEIYSEVDVMKSDNYTIALRVKTCEMCKLNLTMVPIDGHNDIEQSVNNTISFQNSSSGLQWVYLNNTYLLKGKYGVRIESNSQTDLDLFVMYSKNDPYTMYEPRHLQGTLDFELDVPPAYLTNYNKISPNKYLLHIENATRPYVLSLAESYDPLWIAYTNDKQSSVDKKGNDKYDYKASSIPLFSIINGFQINKTGSYSITVEYEPLDWFFTGAKVSLTAVILLLISTITYYLIRKHKYSAQVTNQLWTWFSRRR